MVKRALLAQKLASYSVLATVVISAGKSANAQIIYTKVDTTICPNSSYSLDLNGDGITDFVITAYSSTRHIDCGYTVRYRFAELSPYDNSRAVAGNGIRVELGMTKIADTIINSQQPIGGNDNFISGNTGVLVGNESCIRIFGNLNYGLWDTTDNDKFVGLRKKINNDFYYGWARLSILTHSSRAYPGSYSQNGYCVVLTDYAFSTQPNVSILAGEEKDTTIIPNVVIRDNNDNFAVFPNPVSNTAPLNINCALSYAQSVTISLYDMLGRQVSNITIANSAVGLNTFQIPVANLAEGVYMVKFFCTEFSATKEIVINK